MPAPGRPGELGAARDKQGAKAERTLNSSCFGYRGLISSSKTFVAGRIRIFLSTSVVSCARNAGSESIDRLSVNDGELCLNREAPFMPFLPFRVRASSSSRSCAWSLPEFYDVILESLAAELDEVLSLSLWPFNKLECRPSCSTVGVLSRSIESTGL